MQLSSTDVAGTLGISPMILREWVMRLDFPTPLRNADGRVRFDADEVSQLRDQLSRGHSPAAAIERARHARPLAASVG